MSQTKERVVGAAITTPISLEGTVEVETLALHALDLLKRGATHIALFGTTGEGSAFGAAERTGVIDGLVSAGVPPSAMGVGIFESAVDEASARARDAFDRGLSFGLICPPLYFKDVTDDGLFSWFEAVVDALGDAPGELVLYHIPQVTQVPISVGLIRRLHERWPERFTSVKDSAGDWPATRELIHACPDVRVLVGHEGQIADGINEGAVGSICALANVVPEAMAGIITTGQQDERVVALIDAAVEHFLIGAVKALVALDRNEPVWNTIAAPLGSLAIEHRETIEGRYREIFSGCAAD